MGLFGPDTKIEMAVDRPMTAPYFPGEAVQVTAKLHNPKDLKVRQGTIALVREEKYEVRYEERVQDSDGDWVTRHTTTWRTDAADYGRIEIAQNGVLPGGPDRTDTLTFTIPTDEAPTYSGKITRVRWLVLAKLDRQMAADVTAEAPLTVLNPAPAQAATDWLMGRSEIAEMGLWLPGDYWTPGESFTGTLLVRPLKDFNVTEVRVELTRSEDVPEEEGNRKTEVHQKVKVAEGTKFQPGQPGGQFPFTLTIPANPVPSAATQHSAVTWTVKAVLARRLKSDDNLVKQIFVYNGPRAG